MWSWLTKILEFLPGIGSLFSSSEKVEEMKAQVKLEEARAFTAGRVAPRYIRGYVLCGIALIFGLLVAADALWPEAVDLPSLDSIAKALRTLFSVEGD